MASKTLCSHSPGLVIWKTPKPRIGISMPLFNLISCIIYQSFFSLKPERYHSRPTIEVGSFLQRFYLDRKKPSYPYSINIRRRDLKGISGRRDNGFRTPIHVRIVSPPDRFCANSLLPFETANGLVRTRCFFAGALAFSRHSNRTSYGKTDFHDYRFTDP